MFGGTVGVFAKYGGMRTKNWIENTVDYYHARGRMDAGGDVEPVDAAVGRRAQLQRARSRRTAPAVEEPVDTGCVREDEHREAPARPREDSCAAKSDVAHGDDRERKRLRAVSGEILR